jgi:hypothetical protein
MEESPVMFFGGKRTEITLIDVKPKLNSEKEKRIRLDFAIDLTSDALAEAPENIKEAYYAVTKDSLGLNPVGIVNEFQDAAISFYATKATKAPSLEVAGCTIRKLSVERKKDDVRLKFHINVPASREVWNWCFGNYGCGLAAEFEDMQPMLPHIKAAEPDGDGQGILEMEKSDPQPTVADANNVEPEAKKKSKKKKKK